MKEELKELQESLSKSIDEGLESIKAQVGEEKEASQKNIDELNQKLADVTEKLEKLEKTPVGKVQGKASDYSEKYKGRKLSSMGSFIKNKCVDNKKYGAFRSEEKCDEFAKFMIDVVDATMGDNEAHARLKTTMNHTTGSQGGYAVPIDYQWDLIMLNKDKTFALNTCKVMPLTTDKTRLPKELTRGAVAWKDESAQMTQSDPTFGQVELDTQKLTAYSHATNELLQDSAIDIVSLLTDQFSYGTALELDNQVLNGTGSPVSGVLTANAGFSVVMSGSHFSAISFDDISSMIDKIPEGYDDNLTFVFNKTVKHYLRILKDSQNRYLLNAPGGTTPGTLWEEAYIQSSQAPGTSGTDTAFVALGNFQYFYIGNRIGQMTIEADPFGRFDYNETRFRMVTRWALEVAVQNAFCRLITGS